MEEKLLHLVLKREWYCMIEEGIKKEEYRNFNDYWKKRLLDDHQIYGPYFQLNFKHYTHVAFHFGYTNRIIKYRIAGFDFGQGKKEWGAKSGVSYFIIKLGERVPVAYH